MSILEIIGLAAALITIAGFLGRFTKKAMKIKVEQRERLLSIEREIEEYAKKATTQAQRQDLFIFISEELSNARYVTSTVHRSAQKLQLFAAAVIAFWSFVYVEVDPGLLLGSPGWIACGMLVISAIASSVNIKGMNESISSASKGFRSVMEAHLETSHGAAPLSLL